MADASMFHGTPESTVSTASPETAIWGESNGHNGFGEPPLAPLTKTISSISAISGVSIATDATGYTSKTDKPRPHVCTTCMRSFARLEHLKRHERSHTKEKPFECPECARCFARRDLLLRHQQKLHLITTPLTRPKAGRRESSSSVAGNSSAKVRKGSAAAGVMGAPNLPGQVRPRANTISHVDGANFGMYMMGHPGQMHNEQRRPTGPNINAPQGHPGFPQHGPHLGMPNHPPRIDTHGLGISSGGMRTAPPVGNFTFDQAFAPTINPAQLQVDDHMRHGSPYAQQFGFPSCPPMMEEEETFDWMPGFSANTQYNNPHEQALGGSSPSNLSTGSGTNGMADSMMDSQTSQATAWAGRITMRLH
ncbi:hypothetical protein MRB53_040245 [Persea americana]|nr:hypothetical protein MRB53_040245 [Persea americana]